MKHVRIVLDTNVLVSGLISEGGPPGRLINAVRHQAVTLVLSEEIIAELGQVLARPRMQKYLREDVAEVFAQTIDTIALIVPAPLPKVDISPDPKDNMVLATAVTGHADLIVSGDKRHLLQLDVFEGIPIRTPGQTIQTLVEGGLL